MVGGDVVFGEHATSQGVKESALIFFGGLDAHETASLFGIEITMVFSEPDCAFLVDVTAVRGADGER